MVRGNREYKSKIACLRKDTVLL
jgi:hypothetical protein